MSQVEAQVSERLDKKMSTQSRIKIIYGAGLFGRLADENEQQESLEIIARHNVAEIDTATVYVSRASLSVSKYRDQKLMRHV